MSSIALLFGGLQLLFIIFSKPLASLLLYGIAAADRDSYSILYVMSTLSNEYKILTRLTLLLLLLFSLLKLSRSLKFQPQLIRISCKTAIILALIIVLGSIAKGHDTVKALSYLVYSGIPVFLIWISYSRELNHKRYFLTFVGIQAIISLAIIYVPVLSILDGAQFKMAEGFSVIDNSGVNTSIPDGSANKQLYGRYAQFHNPNALGLYSTVVLAIGISLAQSSNSIKAWTISAACLIAGSILWLNSLTRGPLVFLIAVWPFTYILILKKRDVFGAAIKLTTISIVILIALMSGEIIDVATYLIPDSSNVSVQGRFDGYLYGISAILDSPLLGVPVDWDWSKGDYPHFIGLAFAADYGIAAGIIVMIIVFAIGGTAIVRGLSHLRTNPKNKNDIVLGIFLIAVCWGIAASNNLAAPVIFWICFAEALRLISREKENLSNSPFQSVRINKMRQFT